MNQMHFTKKAAVLSGLFTIMILCGTILIIASNEPANITYEEYDFYDRYDLKAGELQSDIRRFDKIDEAYIYIEDSNDEISRVYALIFLEENLNDSEKSNLLEYLSMQLENLETEKITITYMDSVSREILNAEEPGASAEFYPR